MQNDTVNNTNKGMNTNKLLSSKTSSNIRMCQFKLQSCKLLGKSLLYISLALYYGFLLKGLW
jgi:hypothetical protein